MRAAIRPTLHGLLGLLALALVGCPDSRDDDDAADDDDSVALDDCEPEDVQCVDDIILDLSLHDDKVADVEVSTTTDGDDFVSHVDATAGGYNEAANNPFVYMRFEQDGLTQVEIDDETALESQEWHIAARRFIIRLNGGSSGPSCVGARTFPEMDYEDLTEVPDGTSYNTDAYYTGDCTIINDSSGLPGSPQVVLGPWWSYTDCVSTTGTPALIELQDGRVVRFMVEAYYETGQEGCNNGAGGGTNSGTFTWRWGFVE
jgi:hypothetical protein